MEKKLTEEQIDAIVMAEADDEEAWEFEAYVERPQAISLRLDTGLIRKLKMLSSLHGKRGYQTLLKEWISEKVNQETQMLKDIKGNLDTLDWDELAN